jgi:nucleoside-diphosphate-sugar epimerase
MKAYLITGGAGFIGSHLADALLSRGDRVVILDNFTSGRASNLRESDPHCTILEGSVLNLASEDERIGEVDAVIHLAALISGHDSLLTPDEYVDINVRGLLRVIEFVRKRRIPRIIFASSSTVYGNNTADSLTEATLPAPTSVYALSKLAGEHLLQMYEHRSPVCERDLQVLPCGC